MLLAEKLHCIKNSHGIYFIKYINYFHKMLRGSEYTRVLNISGFWIFQGHEYAFDSEYARALNKPGFWISQGSEYTKVLNTRRHVTHATMQSTQVSRLVLTLWYIRLGLEKCLNYLTELRLILWYITVRLEKYSDYLTRFGLIIWYKIRKFWKLTWIIC